MGFLANDTQKNVAYHNFKGARGFTCISLLMTSLLLPESSTNSPPTRAVGCMKKLSGPLEVEVEVCLHSESRHSSEALSSPSPHLLPPPPFPCKTLMPVEDASPCATLPRSHLAQVGPVPERWHSLGDLSRSPTLGRRAATYATSSSADISPLRRVLTRGMNACPHQHRQQRQPLHTSACAVVLEQPVCSPLSLWHFVSK